MECDSVQSVGNSPKCSSRGYIVQFKLYRDNANASLQFTGADPVNATVGVTSFDTHIQLNSLGSTDQYVK